MSGALSGALAANVTFLSYLKYSTSPTLLGPFERKDLCGVEDTHTPIMTKTLLQNASDHIQTSLSYLSQHKPVLLTLLLSPLIPFAYLDYQGWYNLGAGGLPHNALGWLMQSLLRLCADRNLRDAKPYDVEILTSELEKTSFLRNRLPAWEGKSPKTGKWVAPHRQLEQGASAEIKTVCVFAYSVDRFRYATQALQDLPSLLSELYIFAGSRSRNNPHRQLKLPNP